LKKESQMHADARRCVWNIGSADSHLRVFAFVCGFILVATAVAQDSLLEPLPGYERYRLVMRQSGELNREGHVTRTHWTEDGQSLYFSRGDERLRFCLIERVMESVEEGEEPPRPRAERTRRPPRAQQRDVEPSPDGMWRAICRDFNVVIEAVDGDEGITVTTEGHRKHRFGKAGWVYGEELHQIDAMWWSPDSRRLAYYDYDERGVPDYHLTGGLIDLRTEPIIESYPKPGDPNPIAHLWLYDIETDERVRVDVGEETDQYIYNVRFSPDGGDLIFSRTNRQQNALEIVAADAETVESRIVVAETQETWQHNRPEMRFLADGRRFIWETEKTGWKHYELRSIHGGVIATLTQAEYPAASIIHVDEASGQMFYTAYSGEHPLNTHLHRVNLDGTDDRRLTNGPLNHTIEASPCGQWFIVRGEMTNGPATTWLIDREGQVIATLAEGSRERAEELGLTAPELFTFKADDSETDLYGVLFKPSNFDPQREYPLLISVYGGPTSQRVRNTYRAAEPATEFGFIIAQIDNRGTINRGKAFADAVYLRLGDVDMADQVAGVKHLIERPYIDGGRVGIYGHSYGGYLAALGLLKYPDVFHAAVAGGAVTDWRNYDTIYTERYMWLPCENEAGYDEGSCLVYADQLCGALLIQHGMLDDNVHPSNAWQLVDALHRAGRDFSMMMYPRNAHGLGPHAAAMRWRFLHEHLIENN
jgi:dipeptidyl-peptidase 4